MPNDDVERFIELKLGLVKDELNRAWQQVDRQGDIRFKIKAWCTTAWLASLAIYSKNLIGHSQAAILVLFQYSHS